MLVTKKRPQQENSGNNKIQKLAHDEVLSKPSHVYPDIKEEATSVIPVMEVIVDSKVTTLIINQSQYKVLKPTLPFYSQVLAVRTVVHETVATVRKENIWTAIGLYGKRRNHQDKALGHIN